MMHLIDHQHGITDAIFVSPGKVEQLWDKMASSPREHRAFRYLERMSDASSHRPSSNKPLNHILDNVEEFHSPIGFPMFLECK